MKKCVNCPEPVEDPQYKFCKSCWWEQDSRNDGPRQPYCTQEDRNEKVTAGMMIEMLKKIPEDYLVSFDSACGRVVKGDFTIYNDSKEVSINGG